MSARLSSLLSRATELTRAEYRILSYLIDNPTQVGKLTIRALAQANFVSTTTIMRLCPEIRFFWL
ncbi:Helix-turn-helix domain, rpiR family [Proteus vulgaris]|nr:Helix-turn-helix domain, rpiR family [Proteus vulgaris]